MPRCLAGCCRATIKMRGDEIILNSNANVRFRVLPKQTLVGTVARFRQINMNQPNTHHDALELPSGQIVLLTRLCEGQHATVLQLPAVPRATEEFGDSSQPG